MSKQFVLPAKMHKPRLFKLRDKEAVSLLYAALLIERGRIVDESVRVLLEDVHARVVRAGYHALYPKGNKNG